MQATDVNSLFSRAEQAFVAGRLDAARADLAEVGRLAGDHPAALHLLALVEKKRGDIEASRRAFVRALALAPSDPQINNNFGNLLQALGDTKLALAHFDKALAASPRFNDARFNRALLLQRIGRLGDALSELEELAANAPAEARFHSARGAILKEMGRIDEAAAAFDRALELDPKRMAACRGRARIALERGEASAPDYYRRALEQNADDLETRLGLAEALEATGGASAIAILHDAVDRNPGWVHGHEQLSRMRAEAGEGSSFADSYVHALKERPQDRALHYSYWKTLMRGGWNEEALAAIEAAGAHLAEDQDMIFIHAVIAGEAGAIESAGTLLARLDDSNDVRLARARHALQSGDPPRAAALLERVVQEEPDDIAAWANLDVAWRLLGDPRHLWLSAQPGLVGTSDIGFSEARLSHLAEFLRALHRTRAHPIGQSLRGGTQTRGALFLRREPEVVELRDAIRAAVRRHIDQLPPPDAAHPLLRHRDKDFHFSGSWSVRLSESGFHVNHIHPQGMLSSACYIALPASLGSAESKEGWLDLGAPPDELRVDLPPLVSIEPRPGRLALFPSYLYHGTRPFGEGERLTVAFDVAPR